MPAFKVLKSEPINDRAPAAIGTSVILSETEASPFVSAKVLEPIAGEAPTEPIAPTPHTPAEEE